MALIDLSLLKRHLKLPLDVTAEDAELDLYRAQAEAVVVGFITRPDDEDQAEEIAGWDEESVPPAVQAAVLRQAMEFYRYRGDDEKGPVTEWGVLSPGVEGILTATGYRRPVIA